MATYRAIASTETDPNSPVTSTLMVALAENPLAIAEGASGAPKIAVSQASATAGTSSSLTFSGLGDFEGVVIRGAYVAQSANRTVTLQISTDGSSFTDTTTIIDNGSQAAGSSYELFFDFDSGDLECVFMRSTQPQRTTATLSGASNSITHIRLNTSTDMAITAMCYPNGGRSTT